MDIWGIVVAGGTGLRYGGLKQLETIAGRRVIDRSVDALRAGCGSIVVVVPTELVDELGFEGPVTVVAGGVTRSDSVRAGLAAVGSAASHVLIHDAARPLATADLIRRMIATLDQGALAAIPVIGVSDSLRTVEGTPIDRAGYVAVQTPQGFEIDVLRQAHASGDTATDDATLLHQSGVEVVHVEGETTNIKITEPHDLKIAELLFERQDTMNDSPTSDTLRVGQGFDVHPWDKESVRNLVLGGVQFDGARAVSSHSDGDVVAHACIDALLGAVGLGDIGEMFPDTDPEFAGADSIDLLRQATDRLGRHGFVPVNIDCVVVLDEPKVAPRRAEMQDRLSEAAGAPVTVKGKRTEKLESLGDGPRCFATALVRSL